MPPDGSRDIRNSFAPMKINRNALKKGPWTTSEDMVLIEYVKKHGEGNWNAVQRNSGLMRCGKSCRLRWANHLRPNLKKGAFSPEEENLIIELHAKLGNKWARMAAQLPGRTDNEIKNYWNTRLKRRQRAGLPIYPQEMQQELQQYNSPSSPNSLSSLLNSSHPTNPNLCYYETFQYPPKIYPPQEPYLNNQYRFYRNNGSLTLSLAAPDSSFSSSALPMPPYLYRAPLNPLPTPPLIPYNNYPNNFCINPCNNMGLGLSSIQTENAVVTPSASSSNFLMATTSSDDAEDREVKTKFSRCNNTGLLEDLLGESQAFTCNVKPKESSFVEAVAGDMHEKAAFGIGAGTTTAEINYEGKEKKAAGQGINPVDDDLLNLLDNFPLSVPIPEWNGGNGHESHDLANGTNGAMESQREYKPVVNSSGTATQEWNFGSNLWNNMPSIY